MCPVWAGEGASDEAFEDIYANDQVVFSFLFPKVKGSTFSSVEQKIKDVKKQKLIENIRQLYTSDFL